MVLLTLPDFAQHCQCRKLTDADGQCTRKHFDSCYGKSSASARCRWRTSLRVSVLLTFGMEFLCQALVLNGSSAVHAEGAVLQSPEQKIYE